MYIPKQGDICYIDFAPTKGHEQRGVRPAIVVSKNNYNKLTNLVVLCPITTNIKKFPTHYELLNAKKIKGAVLCEHIRSVDFKARNLTFVEKASNEDLEEILDIINGIIEL
ncbi:MAG: type II toxin-antitoxin system PemK/MazF family toxin [Ruminococcus sp.]|nr:type II toxin-antitoxin system PemK/MazF family toxin [Ruminococcus sp.]